MDYFGYICQIVTNCISMMFVQRIKIAREEKGLLQKELSTALNIDVPMYSRIERGDRKAKIKYVFLLYHLLSIEQEELFGLWITIRPMIQLIMKMKLLITMSGYGNKYQTYTCYRR